MFDVGFWELAIIAVIALLVIGPERLPKAARTAGLWVGRARRMVADVKADIDREVRQSELAELKKAGEEIKNAGTSLKSATEELVQSDELNELKKTSEDLIDSVGDELKIGKSSVESSDQRRSESTDSKSEVESSISDDTKSSSKKLDNSDL